MSGLAVLIATVSVFVAVLAYRRGGYRIKVRATEGSLLHGDRLKGKQLLPSIEVNVVNNGQATVDVRNVSWRTKKKWHLRRDKDALLFTPSVEAQWPRAVRGFSEESFIFFRQLLDTNVGSPDHEVWVRAVVTFATGKAKRTNRLKITKKQLAVPPPPRGA